MAYLVVSGEQQATSIHSPFPFLAFHSADVGVGAWVV
jgi:hypothetical protein